VWGYGLTAYCYAGGADTSGAEAVLDKTLDESVPLLIAAAEAMFAPPDEVDIS
jgi:hypothetical protein